MLCFLKAIVWCFLRYILSFIIDIDDFISSAVRFESELLAECVVPDDFDKYPSSLSEFSLRDGLTNCLVDFV